MPKLISRRLLSLFAVSAIALIAFAAACGGGGDDAANQPTVRPGDAAATSTTVPVAKATSAPTAAPIKPVSINPEEDPEGFLNSLPAREVSCAEKLVGGRVELKALLTGGDLAVGVSASAVAACFSTGTMTNVLVGQIEADSGPLSDATKECIGNKSAGIAFDGMFSGAPQPDAILGMFQAAFCLDADERLALQSAGEGGLFGGGDDAPSIDDLECFVNDLGPEKMGEAFGLFAGTGGALDPDFFGSAVKCGLVTDEDIADSGMTTEQMSCMFTEAGDLFQGFIAAGDTGTPPDLTQLGGLMGSFETCGIDLAAFGGEDLGIADPDGTVSPDDLGGDATTDDLTPEQGLCVATTINPLAIAAAMTPSSTTGQMDMTKVQPIIDALTKCGIDAEEFLGIPLP